MRLTNPNLKIQEVSPFKKWLILVFFTLFILQSVLDVVGTASVLDAVLSDLSVDIVQ